MHYGYSVAAHLDTDLLECKECSLVILRYNLMAEFPTQCMIERLSQDIPTLEKKKNSYILDKLTSFDLNGRKTQMSSDLKKSDRISLRNLYELCKHIKLTIVAQIIPFNMRNHDGCSISSHIRTHSDADTLN